MVTFCEPEELAGKLESLYTTIWLAETMHLPLPAKRLLIFNGWQDVDNTASDKTKGR